MRVFYCNDGIVSELTSVKRLTFYPEGTMTVIFLDDSETPILTKNVISVVTEVISL